MWKATTGMKIPFFSSGEPLHETSLAAVNWSFGKPTPQNATQSMD